LPYGTVPYRTVILHGNVVTVYARCRNGGVAFFATERDRGGRERAREREREKHWEREWEWEWEREKRGRGKGVTATYQYRTYRTPYIIQFT
jgi:hypothetical protein